MAYSNNIYLPNVRRTAVNLVFQDGWSVASCARYIGVHRSTIWRWCHRPGATDQRIKLVNRSCRPHSHPKQLAECIIQRILELRWQLKRCSVIIHAVLCREGCKVSLVSVGRVLARCHQVTRLYGRLGKVMRHRSPRPKVETPGSFMQLDTIHFANWKTKQRIYVYTLIDLRSRWAYAQYSERISPPDSAAFVAVAQAVAPFKFTLIQTDNGQEFGSQFELRLKERNIAQRRIRLGRKNDNAHIERFNRTLQDECLGRWPTASSIPDRLETYLEFYNTKRLHLGIQCNTPADVLQRY
jgi:transposase InsO family protein